LNKLYRLLFLDSTDARRVRELDERIPLKGDLPDIPDSIQSLEHPPLGKRFYDGVEDFRSICRQLAQDFKGVEFSQRQRNFAMNLRLSNGKIFQLSYNVARGQMPDCVVMGIQTSDGTPWLSWLRLLSSGGFSEANQESGALRGLPKIRHARG
jgi:hypothetical protein